MNDLLKSKIELLQEQIDNLEKSGFFTEMEMDRLTPHLRAELEYLTILLDASIGMENYANSLKKTL